jgi:DNA-binding protein H-NS
MARSLTKIKQQIAQLQKQADSIQSSIIARIRKEIALHGLTAEHLFGSTAGTASAKERRPRVASAKSAGKPAKFADEQGNTWGGMGKRPQWIHDALSAGRSLDEFLVTAAKPAAKSKAKGQSEGNTCAEGRSGTGAQEGGNQEEAREGNGWRSHERRGAIQDTSQDHGRREERAGEEGSHREGAAERARGKRPDHRVTLCVEVRPRIPSHRADAAPAGSRRSDAEN